MNIRSFSLILVVAVALAGAFSPVVAQPPVSEEDTIAFLGMEGSPGEREKCLEIYVVNSIEVAGLQARFEFDPTVLTPAFVPYGGETTADVEYELVGRGVDYSNSSNAVIIVNSLDSGVLRIIFLGSFPMPWPILPAGSGPIIKVYFDVLPTAPHGGSLLIPADSGGFVFNEFATPQAEMILPTLVGADFDVVPLPYVPGDVDGSGYVDMSDVYFLVNYLFFSGAASGIRNSSDNNGDCTVNVIDITYLVEYVFQSGEVPEIGCVECDY